MEQVYVDRFMAKQSELEGIFKNKQPESYSEIVKTVVALIGDEHEYKTMNSELITEIDNGDYQGTLLYIIPEDTYQPNNYWYVKVGYGSCGGCDALQQIRDIGGWDNDISTDEQVRDYITLALHIVQGIKPMFDDTVY